MRITFCGTGQAYLDPRRAGAAVFVQHRDSAVLLDCGPGSLARAVAAGAPLDRLRAVLLSHLHFDHALGVAELLTRFAFEEREVPAFLGPRGTDEYMASALQFARMQHRFLVGGAWLPRLDHVDVREVASGEACSLAGMDVRASTTPHAEGIHSLAWRVEAGGRALVYSGDSGDGAGAPEAMAELARGADVLIHECYSDDALRSHIASMPPERARPVLAAFAQTHSRVSTVADIARRAGVRTLVLTHLLPGESEAALEAEARRDFGGAIVVAHDGLSIEIKAEI